MEPTHLTEREKAFLSAFYGLQGGRGVDASKAIRAAGYSGKRANQAAYKLMQRPRVAEIISRIERERNAAIRADVEQRSREAQEAAARSREASRAKLFARLHRR
jgi:phage terminase small subunit